MDTKEKLDQLSEFQAQHDLIDIDKRKLLDEVKIPAEVEEIVRNGMKQMSEVEDSFAPTLLGIKDEAETKLALIIIPEEIQIALAEIDRQRAIVKAHQGNEETKIALRIRAIKAEIQANVESKTKDVYAALAQRKAEIEAEFAGKTEAVDENIKKLTDEIKVDVRSLHYTVNGTYLQAVFNKGKKSWISQRLDAYTETHPDIKDCYTVGEPSVTIRKI